MRKKIVCGLDIGSFKICATCGRIEPPNKIDLLATETAPACGVKAGRIIDSEKLSASIKELCRQMRQIHGIKVRRVYLSIDHPDLTAEPSGEELTFSQPTRIRTAQIRELINLAVSGHLGLDREAIYADLTNFVWDGQIQQNFPPELWAKNLKINLAVVSAPTNIIKEATQCLRNAGLSLEGIVPSGCAQACGFFRDFTQDREKNKILMDIGSELTKITLFKDGIVQNLSFLAAGAQNITEDIARKLNLSFACAEQLKIEHGRLHPEVKLFNQKIIVKDNLTSRTIQSQLLDEIIALSADCLLQKIKPALSALNYQDTSSEIIVTGGGSVLEGFLERAEQILERPLKLGVLSAVKDSRIQIQSAVYATSVGLIHYGFRKRLVVRFLGRKKSGPLTHLVEGARKLYREYF